MTTTPIDRAALGMRKLAFFETLIELLPPRSVSDRTCFRRLADWLGAGVASGRFDEDVFATTLLYAREATVGRCNNARAVFMSILRKEIGYDPKRA